MSDTEGESASSDSRDPDNDSDQDEVVDQVLSSSNENSQAAAEEAQDDTGQKDSDDAAGQVPVPPEPPKYGLLPEEDSADDWRLYDVVVVHSIRETSWTTPSHWSQGVGVKPSTHWINYAVGFHSGRFLHFHYGFHDVDNERPDVMHRGGIERQARILIDSLLETRQKFDAAIQESGGATLNRRGIVFVGHDIGGIIIKKALILAAHNPSKYGDIPFNTTHLVFLGTPHRNNAAATADMVGKLLLLPESSFQNRLADAINVLSRDIQETNDEFVDTKVLLHASVHSIVNKGASYAETIVPAPWDFEMCYYNLPYEYAKTISTPHLKLADGDAAAENDSDKFTSAINEKLGSFPFHINPSDGLAMLQKTFLSMSPPSLPAKWSQFTWQPYDFSDFVLGQDKYKAWDRRRSSGVLHIRGTLMMRLFSDKFWDCRLSFFLDTPYEKDLAYFAFSRADSRFNSVDKLLTFMITNIVSRNEHMPEVVLIYDMLTKQRAWTTRDLVQTFRSCYDTPDLRPMSFMVACLEDCDDSIHVLLDLIKELHDLSEKQFRFIFTTTAGANKQIDEALARWPVIDLAEFTKSGDEWTFDSDRRHGSWLKLLYEKKPIYARFRGEINNLLSQWGPDDIVGDMVPPWLHDYGPDATKDSVRKTLSAVKGIDFPSLVDLIKDSFGDRRTRALSIISWVKHAFEPLTIFELGVAVELSEGAAEEDIDDIFLDEIARDVRRLFPAFGVTEYEVDFRLFWTEWRRQTFTKEAPTVHGEIARLCLRYLSFPTLVEKTKELGERFLSLDQTPLTRPRRDLISYAALYWPQHYALAGKYQPRMEALAFFENAPARNAWSNVRHAFSNHLVRLNRSFLSPLPLVSMTGLNDLVTAHIDSWKSSLTFDTDAELALIEAVRNNHATTARLILNESNPGKNGLRDAISAAAAVGNEGILNELIDLAIKVDGFEWPSGLLARTVWLGLVGVTKRLLELGGEAPESTSKLESSLLHLAIEGRHKGVVQLLLDAKYNVESKDESGHTPLAHAASHGCPETIKMLLKAGADPETTGEEGISPIQRAIINGKHKALRALLEGGAKIPDGIDLAADPIENTIKGNPLVVAAVNGYTECVSALLDHGVDINAKLDKCTALWHAAFKGHVRVVNLLLDHGADPNENPEEYDLLLVAVINSGFLTLQETVDLVKILVDRGARVDEQVTDKKYRSNALSRAAGTGPKDLVEYLLEKGAPVDLGAEITETALWVACYATNDEIVDLLIEKGADINLPTAGEGQTAGWTPLHAAYDDPSIVQKLLSHGADINKVASVGSVVYLVSKWNQVESLQLLLNHSTKPDLELQCIYTPESGVGEYEDGMTPLCIACKFGRVEIMRLLLENGAKPDHRTKDGSFPLEFCLDTDAQDPAAVMETLLEFRPDLAQSDNEGNTVLHNISSKTPLAVVKMLYTAGADISATNKAGKTPLLLAVESGNVELAKFLIEKNAEVNAYNPSTGTILHAITQNDHPGQWDMFEAAIKAGGDVHLAHRRGYRETLLHTAMGGWWGEDREKIVRYLLETAKVDPNERCNDEVWCYPLIRCANTHYANALRLLLEHGADPNIADLQGRRAIHIAAYRYWDIVAPLIEGGADLLPRAKSGMTPLHFAAANANNFLETLKSFKEVVEGKESDEDGSEKATGIKIDVNDKDADDWTMLMWIAKGNWSNTQAIEEVTAQGADLWMKVYAIDASGRDRVWTPLKAARYYGSSDEVYEALTPKEKKRTLPDGRTETWDDEVHQMRTSDYKSGRTCSHCLMTITGLDWKCLTCVFNLCYKCARSRSLIHPGHEFDAEGPEFAPLPDSTPEKSNTPTEDAPTPFNGNDRQTESDNLSDDDDDDDDDNDDDDDDDDDDTLSNDSD